jgi:outer membrane protein assembly factor BamB
VIADGRVFVNDFDGTVTAFNAATGAQNWSTATQDFSGVPVASHGEVWIQSGGSIYGLSEKNGAIQTESSYIDGDGGTPGVDANGVFLSTGCQTQAKLSFTGTVI